MIKNDESLVLKFNPFINTKYKIQMKLTDNFLRMSRDMIAHVPEQNREKLVNEVRNIFKNVGEPSFFSIEEMIDFFHSIIKQNSVSQEFFKESQVI
jgi:phosphopantothenate synthetase